MKMKKTRKIEKALAVLLGLILLLAACGQPAPSGTSTTAASSNTAASEPSTASASSAADKAPQPAGEVTVKLLASTGGSGKSLAGSVEAFNAKYAGQIKVQTDMIAQESLIDTMMLQFVSGNSNYDLIATLWPPVCNPYLAPLDEYMKRDGIDAVKLYGDCMQDSLYDGAYRAIPFRNQVFLVYYRTDLFKEAGLNPPKNMDEYLDCARKLTVRNPDGSVKRYGTSLKMQSPNWTVETLIYFFQPLGGFFVTEDYKSASPTIKSDVMKNILKMYKTIQDEKLCPDPLSFTYDDNIVALQTDKVAFCIESSSRTSLMEDPQKSKVVGLFDYSNVDEAQLAGQPSSNSSGAWFLGIDKNSKYAEKAWEFVKWAGSREQQENMAYTYANGPSLLSLYDDPKYIEFDKGAKATRQVMSGLTRYHLPIPQISEAAQDIHNETQNFMLGRQDVDKTVQNIYDAMVKVMANK